jgi:hypothetical protein
VASKAVVVLISTEMFSGRHIILATTYRILIGIGAMVAHPLRANITETLRVFVISEQGEKEAQFEIQAVRYAI